MSDHDDYLQELEISPKLVIHPGDHVRYHAIGTTETETAITTGVVDHITTGHEVLHGHKRRGGSVAGSPENPKIVLINDHTKHRHGHSAHQIVGLVEESSSK
ncbi:hypothetical protein BC828DRAFT_406398 [Blastocladiella britannica]|nr:hypothetical protein BC828DRAFT_406398 [Blastocladiella britannica]